MNIISRCLMALSSGKRMIIKDVTFSNATAPYTVKLCSSSLQQIVAECINAGVNETGGILIGHDSEDGSTAIVFEATVSPPASLSARPTFQRGIKGLRS